MNHHRMRALVSNDDLHVAVVDAPVLMVYSGREALYRACRRGLKIPAYRSGISGVHLFAQPPLGVNFIVLDEGLDDSQKLYLPAPHFDHVSAWAAAVAFERRLAAARFYELRATLRAFDAYLMPLHRGQHMGVLFTAPDLLDAYVRRIQPHALAELQTSAVSWGDVVGKFTVNPLGPGAPRVLNRRPRSAPSGPPATGAGGSGARAAFAGRGSA